MKRVIIGIGALLAAVALPATLTAAPQAEWERVSERVVSGGRFIELRTPIPVSVRSIRPVSEFEEILIAENIRSLLETETLEAERIELLITSTLIEATLFPRRYQIAGRDLVPHLPAGLRFVYSFADNSLQHDFKLKSDELILRIRDSYIGIEALNAILLQALADPVAFIADFSTASYALFIQDNLVTGLAETRKQSRDTANLRRETAGSLQELRQFLDNRIEMLEADIATLAGRTQRLEQLIATLERRLLGSIRSLRERIEEN